MIVRNYMEDSMKGSIPIWSTVIVSVLLHVMLVTIKNFERTVPLSQVPTYNDPIEVSDVPPPLMKPQVQAPAPQQKTKPAVKTKEMQMAESAKADNNTVDPNAKFLGERNQKAEQEMKAKQVDDFRNGEGTGAKGRSEEATAFIPPTAQDGAQKAEETPSALDEMGITANEPAAKTGVKRNWKTLSLKDLGVGGDGSVASATDDKLDGVANGNRTILSTREFKYFSYYHRIKELLRQYWKPSVETRLYKMWARGNSVNKEEMVTSLMVLLDEKGKIQKISRVISSGFPELDDAAIESFQKAGPFPNPPRGILEDDGFVRIKWDFVLRTESAPRINFSSGNGGGGSRGADRDGLR